MTTLNELAWELCDAMAANAAPLSISVSQLECGTRIIDCGVNAPGSFEAGERLARVCLCGLGFAHVAQADDDWPTASSVHVTTRSPVAACMASQYAGWELKGEKFFAMGSGPMRAAACREPLFNDIGCCEKPPVCVGVLETGKLPPESVCLDIAEKCGVTPDKLTLCVARTASPAGTVQIVARSIETALHKMHALGFDINRIERAEGIAPLPPIAADDLQAIGWTNDAILYGAFVILEATGDDASLAAIAQQIPSNASADYGRPFAEIFARYDHDFYRIDAMLFSPASLLIVNADTGTHFDLGRTNWPVLVESFGAKE